MRNVLRLVLIASVLLACTPLWAQVNPVVIDASLRLRVEDWDWFDAAAARDEYRFLGSLLRIGLTRKGDRSDWQIEAAQPALLGLPDDATAPAPQGQLGLGATYFAVNGDENDAGLFVKQAFVRYHGFANAKDWLRIGRFELIDGTESMPKDPALAAVKRGRVAHRLIGNFGFTHVGRSFDGLQYFHDFGPANWTIAAVRPTEGVFSLEGWDELDVDLVYTALTRSAEAYDSRVFVIDYRDRRGLRKNDNVTTPDFDDVEVLTLGGHYLRGFDLGSAKGDLLVWGAVQSGDWGLLDHDASAYDVELGFRPGGARNPAIRVGWFRGSGDPDPADGKHETFFQILPTPRIYARFPFYNLMNNEDRFVEASFKPTGNVSMFVGWHSVALAEKNDLWYAGGGAFNDKAFGYPARPSRGFTDLADVVDLGLSWSISKSTSASFYCGVANGGDVIDSIYPEGSNGRYAYIELTKKFSTKF